MRRRLNAKTIQAMGPERLHDALLTHGVSFDRYTVRFSWDEAGEIIGKIHGICSGVVEGSAAHGACTEVRWHYGLEESPRFHHKKAQIAMAKLLLWCIENREE